MLTATYSLVSLSVEQASVRVSLLSFQKYMQLQLRHQQQLSLAQWQYTRDWLQQLHQNGYWGKVDRYLIPAIRQAAPQAGQLLAELNGLNLAALDSLNLVQQRALSRVDSAVQHADALCAAIDSFCAALMARLEKEERELFALARRVIAGEAWFAIAHQLLAQDAQARERDRERATILPFVLPPADAPCAWLAPARRHA